MGLKVIVELEELLNDTVLMQLSGSVVFKLLLVSFGTYKLSENMYILSQSTGCFDKKLDVLGLFYTFVVVLN